MAENREVEWIMDQKLLAHKLYVALMDAGVMPLAAFSSDPGDEKQGYLFVPQFTGSWMAVRKATLVEYHEFLLVLAKIGYSRTIHSCQDKGLDRFWVMAGDPDPVSDAG